MSINISNSNSETTDNVLSLSDFRDQRNLTELGESYSAFLQKLAVSDLFYEAKKIIEEIQKSNLNRYQHKKADRILKEISRRVSGDSPSMSESLESLRQELKIQILNLNL